MVLSMSRPTKHPKSGVYRARKVVPEDLRAVVGKRELIASLRTKDPAEAKARHSAAMAALEARLVAARAEVAGAITRPTARQIAEIAGEVYRAEVQAAEAEPTNVHAAEAARDVLMTRLDGNHGADELDEREYLPTVGDIAEARDVLAARGIATDAGTLRALAEAIFGARTYAAEVAVRRAGGDWSPDPDAARFPAPAPRPAVSPASSNDAPVPPKVSMTDLLDRFALEKPQNAKTMAKRRAALKHIEAAAGHDDAARVGKADIMAMKTARLARVSPATVTAEIAMLRPLWAWGADNGLLPGGPNPFTGTSPGKTRTNRTERLPFTEAEAAVLLNAARGERGWLRWVPWVLAFTGARLGEVCDAAAGDVRMVDGTWCVVLHTEAEGRTLKTQQAQRMVPLVDPLIAEGFVTYAQALPQGGPLFPDLRVGAWGKRSSVATKTLGRRLRALGIKDTRKVAGHSWRHRMKDLLRFARVPGEAADAILGHENPTNAGSGYGVGWRGRPAETKAELEKAALVPAGLGSPPAPSTKRRQPRRATAKSTA